MTTSDHHPRVRDQRLFDRRRFLTLAGLGAGGLLAVGCSDGSKRAAGAGPGSTGAPPAGKGGAGGSTTSGAPSNEPAGQPTKSTKAGTASSRRLVVIEFDGGNDGLSTLVPFGLAGYGDLRKRTAFDPKDLVHLDDHVGLPKALTGLHDKGLAVVQGIGVPKPDGSHFAMMDRWWRGDVTGSAGLPTGFLGRLCDALTDASSPLVGLSFGSANHPAMQSARANTLTIPGGDPGGNLAGADPNDLVRRSFQEAFTEMVSANGGDDWLTAARRGGRSALDVAMMLAGLKDDKQPAEYPGGQLAEGLKTAARLFAADEHLRVVHVPMGGDFDTHQDHPNRHSQLMTQLNDALVAFLNDLEGRGLRESVLVATTSEFGRSAKDNGSDGLDHGAASAVLLAGPVKAGVHGQHPSLTDLDGDDNLVATIGFDQYYATIAETWFGIPASDVLPGNPRPIDGLLTV